MGGAIATKRFRFASAVSDDESSERAVEQIFGQLERLWDVGPADLLLLFVSPHHRRSFPLLAERLVRPLGARVSLAVSAGAVLGSGREVEERPGIALLVGRMPGVWLHPFSHREIAAPAVRDDPQGLAQTMVGGPLEERRPAALLLFADPFSMPMTKMMDAVNGALPGVPVIGGMASAAHEPGGNRLLLGGEIFHEGMVGVALGGPLRVDCTVSQGCRAVGRPWVITKARHNLIQEVGGQPVLRAIEQTAEAMSPEDRALLDQGLFVGRVISEYKDHFGRGDFLIRNILGVDQDSGYIAVNDLMHAGQTIQFHVRDARTAEEDLHLLLEAQKLHGDAAGVLMCTCNGRGSNMFKRPDTESTLVRAALGEVPLAGFFAAGEIGPIGGQNFLHGFTASLAVFRSTQAG